MTIDEITEIECDHEWVNARCAKCAVVSYERRLREFLEQSSVDYAAEHGHVGPNAHIDIDLHRAVVAALLNVVDHLEEKDRRNLLEHSVATLDWILRVAGIYTLIDVLSGLAFRRDVSKDRVRPKFFG